MRLTPLAACVLAACAIEQTGNTRAIELGDTSHPAPRGSPIAELRRACGDGDVMPGRTVTRHPYVQRVTTSSAMIGWMSTSQRTQRVEVTRPSGTYVLSADAIAAPDGQRWAALDGLAPDTIYCYALVEGEPLTDRTGFRTAPASRRAPVRVLAFGDSGAGGDDQRQLLAHMTDVPYDLIIHVGDISNGHDNVFAVYDQLLRNVPLFPANGNHENRRTFRRVFALPGDRDRTWYSFDWGGVHFVALDTEADLATQMAWLDRDLAATTRPWKVVYLHRPPYSSGHHGSNMAIRAQLAPIVEKHGVQLVLSGHDHDYERTTPQHGVTYIVTGGGGRGTYPVGHSWFTAFSESVIHFVYVEVDADQMIVHAIDATGTEFDSTVLSTPDVAGR